MEKATIKRSDLLASITKNRDAHRALFLKAQDGFRVAVIAELDRMLADARAGKRVETHVRLQAPEDHTGDYDRVVAMLTMSVDVNVTLSANDFARYVLDKWEWSDIANWKNSAYSSGTFVTSSASPPDDD